MTENVWTVLIVFLSCAVTLLGVSGLFVYKSVALRKAQIEADAMVRAEEIKAKNQFELEKLMHKNSSNKESEDFSTDDRKVRERI